MHHRRKHILHTLDSATIEFSRGCPWDCSFCSAWTFFGRSYRLTSPEGAVEDLGSIREPGVFIVDDAAFLQERHGRLRTRLSGRRTAFEARNGRSASTAGSTLNAPSTNPLSREEAGVMVRAIDGLMRGKA